MQIQIPTFTGLSPQSKPGRWTSIKQSKTQKFTKQHTGRELAIGGPVALTPWYQAGGITKSAPCSSLAQLISEKLGKLLVHYPSSPQSGTKNPDSPQWQLWWLETRSSALAAPAARVPICPTGSSRDWSPDPPSWQLWTVSGGGRAFFPFPVPHR